MLQGTLTKKIRESTVAEKCLLKSMKRNQNRIMEASVGGGTFIYDISG